MKKLVKVGLMLTMLALGFSANADTNLLVKVKGGDEKLINLSISDQNAHLFLMQKSGEVIYRQDIIKTTTPSHIFDLGELPEGNYDLVVETDLEVKKYDIKVSGSKVEMSEPQVTKVVKASILKDKNIVTVDLKSLEAKDVEIEIINEYNDQLFSGKFDKIQSLTKKFDINNADGRELTFIVKSADKNTVETIYKY